MEIRKINRRRPRSVDDAELGHFTLLFCRRRQRNAQGIYDARAQLLFCSVNLLFSDVLVAVVVVVCLSSLILQELGERKGKNAFFRFSLAALLPYFFARRFFGAALQLTERLKEANPILALNVNLRGATNSISKI